jgi:hypothetical protein
MNFYMKYIQPIKKYFEENTPEPELEGCVNEPEITDEEICVHQFKSSLSKKTRYCVKCGYTTGGKEGWEPNGCATN